MPKRASRQAQTDAAGVSSVAADFEGSARAPVANASHDLGTDLFVQVRDHR